MPRVRKDNRGGPRLGKPGQAYQNRTDLNQPVRTTTGQQYGQAQQQQQSQQQIPLPQAPPPMGPPPTPLDAPSGRPDEPVTSGAPLGPGPGPESLGLPEPPAQLSPIEELRAIASVYDYPEIRELLNIADLENDQRSLFG